MQELYLSARYRVQIFRESVHILTHVPSGIALALPGKAGYDFRCSFDAAMEASGKANIPPGEMIDELCQRYDCLMTKR